MRPVARDRIEFADIVMIFTQVCIRSLEDQAASNLHLECNSQPTRVIRTCARPVARTEDALLFATSKSHKATNEVLTAFEISVNSICIENRCSI